MYNCKVHHSVFLFIANDYSVFIRVQSSLFLFEFFLNFFFLDYYFWLFYSLNKNVWNWKLNFHIWNLASFEKHFLSVLCVFFMQDIYTIRAYVEEETRRIGQAYQQQHHQPHQHSKNIPSHPRLPPLAQGATQHRPPPQSNRHPHPTFADLHMPYRSNHAYTPSATPSTSQRHPPASNRAMPRPLPISPPWMTPPMAPVPFFSGNAARSSLGMYSGGPPRYTPFPTSNFGANLHPLQAAERAGQQPNTVSPPPRRHSELTDLINNNRSAWSVPQNGNPPPPPGSFSPFPNFWVSCSFGWAGLVV